MIEKILEWLLDLTCLGIIFNYISILMALKFALALNLC
jgi:hypothetical protein